MSRFFGSLFFLKFVAFLKFIQCQITSTNFFRAWLNLTKLVFLKAFNVFE